jgi:hypothetical protein
MKQVAVQQVTAKLRQGTRPRANALLKGAMNNQGAQLLAKYF